MVNLLINWWTKWPRGYIEGFIEHLCEKLLELGPSKAIKISTKIQASGVPDKVKRLRKKNSKYEIIGVSILDDTAYLYIADPLFKIKTGK